MAWELYSNRSEHTEATALWSLAGGTQAPWLWLSGEAEGTPMQVLCSGEDLLMTHVSWFTTFIQKFLHLEYFLLQYLQIGNIYSCASEDTPTSGKQLLWLWVCDFLISQTNGLHAYPWDLGLVNDTQANWKLLPEEQKLWNKGRGNGCWKRGAKGWISPHEILRSQKF